MTFLLRRMIATVLQLFFVSVVAFALFRLLPGDFYSAALQDPQVSRSTLEAMRRASGEDQAWTLRYLHWASSGIRGNFGVSLAYGVPVGSLIAPRIRHTLAIAIPALLLAWAGGFLAALFAVRFRFEGALAAGASAAAMAPDVITISLLLWSAVWAGMPVAGAWLPVLGLACAILPVVFLHVSSELRAAHELDCPRPRIP
jgi:ABC-type dipeptide/oligopeptide/nickel transport system permease component